MTVPNIKYITIDSPSPTSGLPGRMLSNMHPASPRFTTPATSAEFLAASHHIRLAFP